MGTDDLTPAMQQLMGQMACLHAELNSLKERAQARPQPSPPTTPDVTSSRRKTLKRLGLALLGGAAAATAVGIPAQARVISNPALGSSTSKAGAIVVPLGVATPTGNAPSGYYYGLIASGNSTALNLNNLPYTNIGVYGSSGYYGVYGSGGPYGVYGYGTDTGVCGSGTYGVDGTGSDTGVYGSGGPFGVVGSGSSYGVWGYSTNFAGYFTGNVHITKTLTAVSKAFKIDHPLDPANKYLYHTSVESPDMKNIYDGVVTLDNLGEAIVEMPSWFEALNSDYRYQLTCLGQYAPVYIAEKLANRKFKIAGGKPGQEVSWQVTGIRQDTYAKFHRTPVEQDKTRDEKGKYIHPELFGQPDEMSVGPRPAAPKQK